MQQFRTPLLFLFTFICLESYTQPLPVEWSNQFKPQGKNSDRASCITTDSQGNVLVAGYAGRQFAYPDAFVIKYSPAGDTLWTYYYAGNNYEEDRALDMVTDVNDNVYISGFVTNSNYADECFAVKLNASGIVQWANRYTGPSGSDSQGNGIAVDDSGNVYVAGFYDAPSASKSLLVIKYNPNGTMQWTDISNAPSSTSDEVNDIAISPSGNATVCGVTTGVGTSYNIFVKQYTRGGGTAWYDSYTNPNNFGIDEAVGLAFTSTGELRVGGNTYDGATEDANVIALSYSAAGVRQWATIYTDATTPMDELATAMAIDTGGNVYLTALDFRHQEVYRINADGSQGWKRSWRGPVANATDVSFDVAVDGAGNVYAAGKGIYPGPNYFGNNGLDLFTVTKYSPAGDSLWTYKQGSVTDISIGFAITTKGNKVYAAGFKADTAYVDENLYTVILDTAGPVLAEWTFSGEGDAIVRGEYVRTDALDNVYAAGTCDRLYNQTYDVALVKYDPSGNEVWNKVYSSHRWRNDTLTGMEFDPAGNLILSISTDTGGTGSAYALSLVKISPDGVMLDTGWYVAPTGSLFANSMVVRNDGSIVLASNAGALGAALFSFDSLLNLQWVAQLDTALPNSTSVKSLALFPGGDVAAAGTVDSSGATTRKIFVQRISASGTRLWTTYIDSLNVRDEGYSVDVSPAGDVAVVGSTGVTAVAAKLDGITGGLSWRTIYNPTNSVSESAIKVRLTPAGHVVALVTGSSGFVNRWFTVQFNGLSGAQQWATGYSNVASERIPSELLVQSNGTVVTGGTQITGGTIPNWDYVLVSYTTAGIQHSLNTYSTPGIYPDRLHSIASDSQDNLVVTGETSNSFLNDYRYFMTTVKYGPSPVGVEELMQNLKFDGLILYPNPSSTGQFTFFNQGKVPVKQARIFDSTGRLMEETHDLVSGSTVDLSAYPPGIYLVQFSDGNNAIGSVKIIRE